MQSIVQRGITERRHNRHPFIDSVNREAGNSIAAPYCAAVVGHCLNVAAAKEPRYRGGLAIRYRERGCTDARTVIAKKAQVQIGDLAIWRRGDTYKGHIGIVERVVDQRTVVTLEANTSPGKGSVRDGDGIYRRTRTIQPYNYFGIKYFQPVRY